MNGDSITKLLAEFNGREDKEELLEYANVQKAYEGAVAAISDITCEQTAVDAAEQALRMQLQIPPIRKNRRYRRKRRQLSI